MKNILIVDFMYLWNRYYYACPKEHFFNSIFNSAVTRINNSTYDRKYLVLDGIRGAEENKQLLPEYKAKRGSKAEVYARLDEMVVKISKEFPDIKILRNDEEEADTVIAAFAKYYSKSNNVYIYSGDKDLLQLMSFPNTLVTDQFTKDFILSQKPKCEVLAKFKITGLEDYKDIVKFRIFKGDASDCIPAAIPRFKTSLIKDMIETCWDKDEPLSEELLERMNNLVVGNNYEKFEQGKEALLRNWKLMQLTDIPVKEIIAGTMSLGVK